MIQFIIPAIAIFATIAIIIFAYRTIRSATVRVEVKEASKASKVVLTFRVLLAILGAAIDVKVAQSAAEEEKRQEAKEAFEDAIEEAREGGIYNRDSYAL